MFSKNLKTENLVKKSNDFINSFTVIIDGLTKVNVEITEKETEVENAIDGLKLEQLYLSEQKTKNTKVISNIEKLLS